MIIIVAFILFGILMMLVEMLLVPGIGVAGFMSLASLAYSCWYAFDSFGRHTGLVVTSIVLAILVIMTIFILSKKTWRKFALNDEIDSRITDGTDDVRTGDTGVTKTRLAPSGTAVIGGRSCEVKSYDNSMLDPGTDVVVVAVEDNKIIVKPQ